MTTTKKMTGRTMRRGATALTLAAATLLLGDPAPVGAQSAETVESCEQTIGTLGVRGWSCRNCSLTWDGAVYRGRFALEPRVDDVDPEGPTRGILQPGDRIVSVDGHLVTSPEGGRRLLDLDPGQEVEFVYRRDGRERSATVRAGSRCAPEAPAAPAPPAAMSVVVPPSPAAAPRPRAGGPPVPPVPPEPSPAPLPAWTIYAVEEGIPSPLNPDHPLAVAWTLDRRTAPSLGFSIACERCAVYLDREAEEGWWRFDELPTVTAVAEGSAARSAGIRTGDVLLSIDGLPLEERSGGARFANLEPGERVPVEVSRDGRRLELTLQVPESRGTPVRWNAPRSPGTPAPAPAIPLPGADDVLRYVGELGGTDVEVRGVPVTVTEADGLIVIRGAGIEVLLRRSGGEG